MIRLSAFADEVSSDFRKQIDFLVSENIKFIEIRMVNGKNVLDMNWREVKEIKEIMDDNGISVSALGSPIGKTQLDKPFENHFDKFMRAVELTQYFNAPFIRIFSYYAPEGREIKNFRDEVIGRMIKKVYYIKYMDIVLVHENETDIYGATAENCVDLIEAVNSPKLRLAYDPANFVWGQRIKNNVEKCWPMMEPFVEHVHIKDWKIDNNNSGCLPGEGDAQIKELLKELVDKKYSGFLTLEPHLKIAGQFGGETGPDLFSQAVNALRRLCADADVNMVLD